MKKRSLRKTILSAMFLAIGMVLPFVTGQIKEIGDSLLPMHIPVLLCGFICGYEYGLAVGLILPLLRSFSFGMPPLYPNCVYMGLELAAYGFFAGLFYKLLPKKTGYTYLSLILSMIFGRIVWGISKGILLGIKGKAFTFAAFISGGITDAIPGIILQIILIPAILTIINKMKK